ncbi:MAG: RDD family protein [Lacinutrix sp.]|uniref:RDD family protein n=1 Tax=Lacinutrix sp. TaxID=1937692 RepID=UPI0030B4F8BC
MSELNHASVFKRVKAAIIDAILIMMIIYSVTLLLDGFETISGNTRGIVYTLIFLLYEPLFVSFFGASLGHIFCNLLVQKDSEKGENISLPIAIIRFLIESFLDWISLLTISGDIKKKAIHDLIANTVVIIVEAED